MKIYLPVKMKANSLKEHAELAIKKGFERGGGNHLTKQLEVVTVNNLTGYIFADACCAASVDTHIFLQPPNDSTQVVEISYSVDDEKQHEEIVNKILSTFRFD